MQVGDLVTYAFQRPRWRLGLSAHVGIVVETGIARKTVKVMWKPIGRRGGETLVESVQYLMLIDDSLTSS